MAKITNRELQDLLAAEAGAAVGVLAAVLADPLAPKKIKLDVARFIVSTCLDTKDSSPSDNLDALKAILNKKTQGPEVAPATEPSVPAPKQRKPRSK